MANETWKFVQAKSKQAMKQVLGIRDEKARMKVTPPLAVAPITQEDDMRWNPNDDVHVFSSLSGRRAAVPKMRDMSPSLIACTMHHGVTRRRLCRAI